MPEKPLQDTTVTARLSLTEEAIRQVKSIMARDRMEDCGLRVAVRDGGCSGMSYHLSFDKEPAPQDVVLDAGGLKIFIDAKSAPYLQGTVIDFVGGLYGGGFKFSNPNATATCGCGTSFAT
ncbi:MAG TPA: iron-sulfur cluster assembly accessory protein [candidate division Zixibacteria bacterium]|nr:iron-sulfur cluster assembly accessory protein [candidate division Zixibacteria bacterium]